MVRQSSPFLHSSEQKPQNPGPGHASCFSRTRRTCRQHAQECVKHLSPGAPDSRKMQQLTVLLFRLWPLAWDKHTTNPGCPNLCSIHFIVLGCQRRQCGSRLCFCCLPPLPTGLSMDRMAVVSRAVRCRNVLQPRSDLEML